jgi:protein ImuB
LFRTHSTNTGIEIALQRLLKSYATTCSTMGRVLVLLPLHAIASMARQNKISIGINRPSNNVDHLFKLFQLKIDTIEPGFGIELFTLEAPKTEEVKTIQETLWTANSKFTKQRAV